MTDLIPALQTLLSIDSSTKAGAVRALHWVLKLAQSMGLRTGNMDDMVGWAEYGEGDELVAVLGHLDVVPIGSGWTKPPFGGVIEDGRLYGRGATDDKGPILAALFALYDIKRSGAPLGKRVRILFGTEEETGCEDMKYYVNHGGELPALGFTPDGAFPLIHGEKGLLIEEYVCRFEPGALKSAWGGTAANIVPDFARAELADGSVIECRGVSAHGAEPWKGENAVGKLLAALDALALEGPLGTAISFLHERIGMETRGESLGVGLRDALSGPLSFNLGMLRAGETELRVTVNYRYPVTCRFDDCAPQVRAAFAEAGFELASAMHDECLFVPEDAPLVRKLMGVYNAYTGQHAKPLCIGGGTYAKSMPNILAFGPCFPGDEVTEHQPDEYIRLDRLQQNFDLIRLAILALAE